MQVANLNIRKPSAHFAPEIQGLRALAVGLVVMFHIWPNSLPGGYVGVDVFFVISGYLITGLLVRTALRDGRISLVNFYSRRARRLLPVAMVVLGLTFVGTLVWLPQSRWQETVTQLAASALYVQNWILAWLSVDYLGADQAPSPVQHYWSLSIEEQFYLVWPFLMLAGMAIARRLSLRPKQLFVVMLGAIFAASLAASIFLTFHDPASSYFVTHTRLWELAGGGLLSLNSHRLRFGTQRLRVGCLLSGLVCIFAAGVFFSAETPFPGVAALLPTVGAGFVILAGDVKVGAFRGLNYPILRYLGDRSYSIYLWHWPLITFYSVKAGTIGVFVGLALVAITILISHLSYQYIEERFRHPQKEREWLPLAYGGLSMVAFFGLYVATSALTSQAGTSNMDTVQYPGPAALVANVPAPSNVPLAPSLTSLKHDLPVVYGECHQDQQHAEPINCILGDVQSSDVVALIGDSHAAQWVPTLDRIAQQAGWKLVTFTKSACAFADIEVTLHGKPYTSCKEWRENVVMAINALHPRIVFTSQSGYGGGKQKLVSGIRSVWQKFLLGGANVIAFRNTPWLGFDPGDCLSETPTDCSVSRKKAMRNDYYPEAAKDMPGVDLIDMTDAICDENTCHAVVGNEIVFRDSHHLTATYAAALAPYMAEKLGVKFSMTEAPLPNSNAKLSAQLACSALSGGKPFTRKIKFKRDGTEYVYSDGDVGLKREKFSEYRISLTGHQANVIGQYREGSGGIKKIDLVGSLKDGKLVASGRRGRRDCTLTVELPST